MSPALRCGDLVWVDLDPTRGRDQQGSRPALVICNDDYESTGLARVSFAMTEQPRTVARERIQRRIGTADDATRAAVDRWLQDFLFPP